MAAPYTFVIDISDNRNKFVYQALAQKGYRVFEFNTNTWSNCQGLVFLFAPPKALCDSDIDAIPNDSIIFCTKLSDNHKLKVGQKNIKVYYYFDDEKLVVANAYLTAEGVLGSIITTIPLIVNKINILVLGFGRVGKAMCKVLDNNGCKATVVTKNIIEQEVAKGLGFECFDFEQINTQYNKYDLIINTVPALVLKEKQLKQLKKGNTIFDLASLPGGVDLLAAKKLGVNSIHMPGVPGRTAAFTAGQLIIDSVLSRLKLT